MPSAAAVSVHPVSSHATGELIGQVIEEIGDHPDIAVLLATPGHAGALEDVGATLRHLLRPGLLVGATVPALGGQGADERGGPAMGLWAGFTGPVLPLRYPPGQVHPRPGRTYPGEAEPLASQASGAVLLGRAPSPGGGRDEALDRWLTDLGAHIPTAGALSSAGPLVMDDQLLTCGLVGAAFGPEVHFDVVRAPGWRAIGPEMIVSESDPERGLILTLDGVPALERLHRLATDEVPAEEISRINRRLGIGTAAASAWEVGGGDRSNGAIAAGPLAEGIQVRFWVAADPEADLRRALASRRPASPPAPASPQTPVAARAPVADATPATALVFMADPVTRGYRVDPAAPRLDADAAVIADVTDVSRLIGVVAAGQISSAGSGGEGLRVGRAEATVVFLSEPG